MKTNFKKMGLVDRRKQRTGLKNIIKSIKLDFEKRGIIPDTYQLLSQFCFMCGYPNKKMKVDSEDVDLLIYFVKLCEIEAGLVNPKSNGMIVQ